MSCTPGIEWGTFAIQGYTLWPGSCPPSPGLAPCAILICRSVQLTRYSLVTPKRPDATCLMAPGGRAPVAVGVLLVPRRVLAAFARVAARAQAIHRDGERLVRLGADRAKRHRAS